MNASAMHCRIELKHLTHCCWIVISRYLKFQAISSFKVLNHFSNLNSWSWLIDNRYFLLINRVPEKRRAFRMYTFRTVKMSNMCVIIIVSFILIFNLDNCVKLKLSEATCSKCYEKGGHSKALFTCRENRR